MRLGQLARRYNLSQEQIIKFLENHNPGMGPYHNNTKLSDQVEDLIATHFNKDFSQEIVEDDPGNISDEPITEEVDIEEFTTDVKAEEKSESRIQEELDPTLPVVETSEPAREEERKAIATDKLIELLDSEDEEVDLSDITLIKAPKKELEGLKVVGKIDLPEPKPKSKEKEKASRDDSGDKKSRNSKRNELSAEEKEKRRLRAKRKKEEYEARQKKRRQQEEAEKIKARKKAHYEQKLKKKQAAARAKVKEIKEQEKQELSPVAQKPVKPKSSLGRFWAWFWRGEKV